MQNTLMMIECWSSWQHKYVFEYKMQWTWTDLWLWRAYKHRYLCRAWQCIVADQWDWSPTQPTIAYISTA